jgi:hypothetical protein
MKIRRKRSVWMDDAGQAVVVQSPGQPARQVHFQAEVKRAKSVLDFTDSEGVDFWAEMREMEDAAPKHLGARARRHGGSGACPPSTLTRGRLIGSSARPADARCS